MLAAHSASLSLWIGVREIANRGFPVAALSVKGRRRDAKKRSWFLQISLGPIPGLISDPIWQLKLLPRARSTLAATGAPALMAIATRMSALRFIRFKTKAPAH